MRIGIDEGKGLHSTSPKQPSTRRRRDWYPYYAGYTQSFVDAVIGECLEKPTFVIDPWSGSGTTTVTCLKRGVASKGVDINPALTVIARARLTPMGCRAKIEKALERVIKSAQTSNLDAQPSDLLETWMSPSAATRIRGLRMAIHKVLEQDSVIASGTDLGADRLSPMVSFLLCIVWRRTGDGWALQCHQPNVAEVSSVPSTPDSPI